MSDAWLRRVYRLCDGGVKVVLRLDLRLEAIIEDNASRMLKFNLHIDDAVTFHIGRRKRLL